MNAPSMSQAYLCGGTSTRPRGAGGASCVDGSSSGGGTAGGGTSHASSSSISSTASGTGAACSAGGAAGSTVGAAASESWRQKSFRTAVQEVRAVLSAEERASRHEDVESSLGKLAAAAHQALLLGLHLPLCQARHQVLAQPPQPLAVLRRKRSGRSRFAARSPALRRLESPCPHPFAGQRTVRPWRQTSTTLAPQPATNSDSTTT